MLTREDGVRSLSLSLTRCQENRVKLNAQKSEQARRCRGSPGPGAQRGPDAAPRPSARSPNRPEPAVVESGDETPGSCIRGDLTEEGRPVSQGSEVSEAVAAVGEIAHEPTRIVARAPLAHIRQRLAEGGGQPDAIGETDDERGAGAGDETPASATTSTLSPRRTSPTQRPARDRSLLKDLG